MVQAARAELFPGHDTIAEDVGVCRLNAARAAWVDLSQGGEDATTSRGAQSPSPSPWLRGVYLGV
jgi:hypothetical protein